MKIRDAIMITGLCATVPCWGQSTCVSHFTNASNFEWSISGHAGDNTTIIIPAHATVVIPWNSPATIVISGKIPNRPYARQFAIQNVNGCYVIVRQGNAGNILIDKPDAGSVTTCSGDC